MIHLCDNLVRKIRLMKILRFGRGVTRQKKAIVVDQSRERQAAQKDNESHRRKAAIVKMVLSWRLIKVFAIVRCVSCPAKIIVRNAGWLFLYFFSSFFTIAPMGAFRTMKIRDTHLYIAFSLFLFLVMASAVLYAVCTCYLRTRDSLYLIRV